MLLVAVFVLRQQSSVVGSPYGLCGPEVCHPPVWRAPSYCLPSVSKQSPATEYTWNSTAAAGRGAGRWGTGKHRLDCGPREETPGMQGEEGQESHPASLDPPASALRERGCSGVMDTWPLNDMALNCVQIFPNKYRTVVYFLVLRTFLTLSFLNSLLNFNSSLVYCKNRVQNAHTEYVLIGSICYW